MPKGGKQAIVGPDGKGKWEVDGSGVKTPDKSFRTQAKAQQAGRKALSQSGGGELTTRGRDGKIRAKDTIPPARDPRKTKG
jgi:uncharacterized protein DUF2188